MQREMAALGQQAIQQTFDYLKQQEKAGQREKLKNDKEFNALTPAEQEKALDKKAEEKYGIGSDNCHDNAVAESFFQLLKRERIKKKLYGTREETRSDIFGYIEMFYNSEHRHSSSEQMSAAEYEHQYYQRLGSVWIIRGDSCRKNQNGSLQLKR